MLKKSIFAGLSLTLFLAVAAQAADSPLADAAMRGDKAAVRALLKEKADVNIAQGDGSTALHWAAYHDDLELAKLLIAAGADIKAKTRLGDLTALFMAAKNGNASMITLLLDAKAEINSANANGTTPLMLAASSGSVDAVKVLLDRGADMNAKDITNGQTAVMFASAAGRAEVVKLLAARGADLNANTKVSQIISMADRYKKLTDGKGTRQIAGEGGRSDVTAMGGMTALQFAAREGQMNAVRELVAAEADVNNVNGADGMSVLTSAIINGHFDIAKFLLAHGANPNLASKSGLTPLYASIDAQWPERTWYPPPSVTEEKTTHLQLLQALIGHGADPNARLGKKLWFRTFHGDWISPDGATAFWLAAKANDVPAMKILVAAGANPDIRSNSGATPLQAAAGFGLEPQVTNFAPDARIAAVRYLVEELGADVNAKDNQGYTPLHGAALTDNRELIKYLVAMGADVKARAKNVFGGEGESDTEVKGEVGDTVADMANGPRPHNMQFPETTKFLESLGSENSNYCRFSSCVVNTLAAPKKKDKK
jgi:ankyrin repeat protein